MQKILITGAAGDVGSRLTELLRDTYQLRLSDIRTPAGLKADADFVAADLADRAALERAVASLRRYYSYLGDQRAEVISKSVISSPQALKADIQAFADIGLDELLIFPVVSEMEQFDRLRDVIG